MPYHPFKGSLSLLSRQYCSLFWAYLSHHSAGTGEPELVGPAAFVAADYFYRRWYGSFVRLFGLIIFFPRTVRGIWMAFVSQRIDEFLLVQCGASGSKPPNSCCGIWRPGDMLSLRWRVDLVESQPMELL